MSVVGTFLYYCKALDLTISTALSDIALTQAHHTESTKKKCIRLMDHVET